VVPGGTTLVDVELYTLAEHLFVDRDKRKRLRTAALKQLAAHANEITRDLTLSEDARFPTLDEVDRFETEELLRQAAERILRALKQRGIDEEEIRKWLRGETDQDITGIEE